MIRRLLLSALAPALLLGAGCRHKCNSCLDRDPKPYLPPPPGSVIGPPTGGSNIPPPGVPTTPPSSVVPGVGPSGSSPIAPPPPNRELLLPDQFPGGPSSRSAFPDTPGVLGAPVKPQTSEPPVAPRAPAGAAGLPNFTKIRDGVVAGGKPALEGFDSLKQAGYRTVVYLHPAGADIGKVKDLTTSRGLTLVPIETTPEKLGDAFEQLNKTIADSTARPLYVFSDDGVRTGAVCYLYFRLVELESPEVAKIRATALGLTEAGDEGKAFWVAIQQYLASR